MTTSSFGRFAWNHCPICGKGLEDADDGQGIRPYCDACNRFYYSNPAPAACCLVTNEKDELLFVQRSVEPRRGMWTLPGGFVELGETTEEAAIRELEEETGLKGRGVSLVGISTRPSKASGGIIVIAYEVQEWEGEIVAMTDAMDAAFYPHDKRPAIAFEVHMDLLEIYDTVRQNGHRLPPVG